MTVTERQTMADPEAGLENALIEEFLRSKGIDAAALAALPPDERQRVLAQASVYATSKLAEIEARAHFVHELHHEDNSH